MRWEGGTRKTKLMRIICPFRKKLKAVQKLCECTAKSLILETLLDNTSRFQANTAAHTSIAQRPIPGEFCNIVTVMESKMISK